jgi:beta-lactamase class A
MLNNGEVLSRDWSQHLLALMGPPKHHHKFVAGLTGRTGVTFIARKSGTWREWHSDAALIQHDNERYVAVALSELSKGEEVMQELIRVLDDLVMQGKYRKPARTQS